MATVFECAVQPSGETAATSKTRPGCVLAAAGLAVAAGCFGAVGTWGLGLSSPPRLRVGLNREWGYGEFGGGDDPRLDGKPSWRPQAPGSTGWMMCTDRRCGPLQRSLRGSPEAGTHGVPTRSLGTELTQGFGGGCRGGENPQNPLRHLHHFARCLRAETGCTHGVRYPQARRGIRGLTCPFPSRRLSWQ